ncbi:glycine betaine ABC transporter substrate-binding protein [Leucobacter sp. 1207-22]|uniref:glycine betaine ABC transporter substrate-binding protein n=1 Tax=Leucobacter sp. 1207-22 TaxID=2604456 RepID=UPI0040628C88
MKKRNLIRVLAVAAAASLTLAGCSSNTDAGDSGDAGDAQTITLGYLPSWTDGLSTAYLLENQLGKLGYDVKMEEFTEPGVIYAGLANGDFDMYPSAWSEATHKSYMDEFGSKIEDVGAYYDGAALTIAVPDYMTDVNSIEDLKGKADRFGGEIIGIEPGAGLTKQTQEVMMPEYELDGEYDLVTSSTGAMLATLKGKIDAKEDVVVTLWKPFWANAAFPVKTLTDPKGGMGETEALHFLGTKGFSEKYPEAAKYIEQIKLDDDAYGALEELVTGDEYKNNPEGAVEAWVKDHADAYPGIIQ